MTFIEKENGTHFFTDVRFKVETFMESVPENSSDGEFESKLIGKEGKGNNSLVCRLFCQCFCCAWTQFWHKGSLNSRQNPTRTI